MNKWFNIHLYREALRQNRLIGWMAFIVYMLEAVLIPLYHVINFYNGLQMDRYDIPEETAMSIHPLMLGLFLFVAPLMTLVQFQFMNRRNAADFYHSIPDTRTSVFLSMYAAIITWCIFLISSGFVVAVAFRLCFGSLFFSSLNILSLLQYMLVLLAGCVLISGLVATAMCLTGTIFTNIMVALMLFVVPRALIWIVSDFVYGAIPFAEVPAGNVLLNWTYHIPLGTVAALFGTADSVWGEWPSIIYTLLVGLLYVAAAWGLFCHRKSESAGKAALNRVLQTVFRLIIPSLISIAMTIALFTSSKQRNGFLYEDWFFCTVVYVIAILAYLLYELITTRKWINVWRSLPGLILLIGINGMALIGGEILYRSELSFRPSSGTVTEVQYVAERSRNDYFVEQMNSAILTDRALCDALSVVVTEQAEAWEQSDEAYRKYVLSGDRTPTVFRMKDQDGRSWIRKVYIDSTVTEKWVQAMYSDEALREKLHQLPEAVNVQIGEYYNDTTASELYESFRAEVAEMEFDLLYQVSQNPYHYDSELTLWAALRAGNEDWRISLNLSPILFPQTYNAYYMTKKTMQQPLRNNLLSLLKEQKPQKAGRYVNVDARSWKQGANDFWFEYRIDSTENDGMTELDECFYTHLIQLLEEVIETPHTADRILVVLQVSTGVKTEGEYIQGEGWIAEFSITPAQWEELKKMVPKEATSLTPR